MTEKVNVIVFALLSNFPQGVSTLKRLRDRRLYADVITARFLRSVLNAPTVIEDIRDCVRLTVKYDGVEYFFEVICQFRGNIIYVTPPAPGNRDSIDEYPRSVTYQKLKPWHIRKWRPSRGSENSCITLFDIHTVFIRNDETLKGRPTIFNPDGGDLAALRELRERVNIDHKPEVYRPIGIELRVRDDGHNFSTIFQEKRLVGEKTLARLERKLKDQALINETVRQQFKAAGYNFLETRFGSGGFKITAKQLEPFEFHPGWYYGK